ncbi:MAG: hypothetical protein WD967_01340 [Candidatus Levyibacteriota bacterium]
MATLSSTTAWTRKIIKWVGIGVGLIVAGLILFRLFEFVKNQITPPPPPTVSFGKLPQIAFPHSQTDEALSYSIDTITGALPVFPDRTNVYKTIEMEPDLLALDKATEKVSRAGFNAFPSQVSEGVYQWSDGDSTQLPKKMVFNIFSSNFNISSPFLSDPQVLSANNLPNETAAINTAQNFLSDMSSLPEDLDLDKTQATLFSIKNGSLAPSTSLSNTQAVLVSFFQKNLNSLPIVYPNPNSSTMSVLVSGGERSPQVVKVDFFHQNIASESATYPIVTAQVAFDKLKNGEVFVASHNGGSDRVSIKEVYLGYYLGDQIQAYVMPVVVFKGNNGFTAYASAIKDDWTQN